MLALLNATEICLKVLVEICGKIWKKLPFFWNLWQSGENALLKVSPDSSVPDAYVVGNTFNRASSLLQSSASAILRPQQHYPEN